MKSGKKIALITAVTLIAAGVILAVLAVALGGHTALTKESEVLEDVRYCISDSFDSIDVSGVCSDIYILPTGGEACVVCSENKSLTHKVNVSGGTLKVSEKYEQKFIFFNMAVFAEDPKICLYLPEREYKKLIIGSVSGKIDVPEEFSFTNAKLETTSGAISMKASEVSGNISADTVSGSVKIKCADSGKMTIETTSGKVTVEDSRTGDVSVFTVSGSVHFEDLACGSLDVETTSGRVEADNTIAEGEIRISTISGGVALEYSDAAELDISTTSGSISGTLLSDKCFNASSSSGSINVPYGRSDAGKCHLKTTSGGIKIEVAD